MKKRKYRIKYLINGEWKERGIYELTRPELKELKIKLKKVCKKIKITRPTKKIFKQNPIQSWKDWKEGFNRLTPTDHAIAKRAGHFWGTLGASTASMALLLQFPIGFFEHILPSTSTLGFGMLIGAISFLQFCEWRKENQKIAGLERMKDITKQTEAV